MRVYAAMEDAVVVAHEEGGEWGSHRSLNNYRPEAVAAHPDRPARAFCGTFESGLRRTTDGGDGWHRVGDDVIDSDAVMAVAHDPRDPDVVWAGTEPSGVYRSTDGGDSWEALPELTTLPSAEEWYFPPRPDTHHVRWIQPHPRDDQRWYVAIEAGALVRTEDGGDSWLERPEGARRDNHTLATHPDEPERVYTAAGDGYAESSDGGDSWSYPQEGLEHRYVWGLAVDPADPDRVVVSAASGAGAAHRRGEAYLYRRSGDRWERIDPIPTGEGTYRAILAAPSPEEFWACHNLGIYRSTDGADSFERIDVHWPSRFEAQTCRGLAVVR